MFRPIASSAEYPNSRSASGFHDVTTSFGSIVVIAVWLSSTSAS